MSAPVLNARVSGIAAQIGAVTKAALKAKFASDSAREDATNAAQGAVTAREVLMGELCALSIADAWSESEIDLAIGAVAKMQNDTKSVKSVQTMLSEVKVAALPRVRAHFATVVSQRNAAWDREETDKIACKQAGVPHDGLLARTFSRRYQTLTALLRAVNEGTIACPSCADDVFAYAETRDPNNDPEKLAARIASAAAELQSIGIRLGWRLPNLHNVVGALNVMGAPEVKAALTPVVMVDHTPATVEESENLESGAEENENLESGDASGEENAGAPNEPAQSRVVTTPASGTPIEVDQSAIDELIIG